MKKLFILTAVIASSLVATKGYSQIFVGAHIGLRVPAPRVYARAVLPAPVIYAAGPAYVAPAPVYAGGYYAAPGVIEAEFHAAYFNHGGFDNARFAQNRGFANHGRRW